MQEPTASSSIQKYNKSKSDSSANIRPPGASFSAANKISTFKTTLSDDDNDNISLEDDELTL